MYKLSIGIGSIIGRHSTRFLPRHVSLTTYQNQKGKLNGNLSNTTFYIDSKTLFTDQDFGIDRLIQKRRQPVVMQADRYIERLKTFLDNDETQSLFLQDLATLISLAETDEHLDLIDRLLETFQDHPDVNENQLRSFTPTVCQLYYHLGKSERALKNVLEAHKFGSCFQRAYVYKIVMTMLYNDHRYEEVLKLYEVSKERLPIDNRSLKTLALAAYARINTPEAFEEARKLAELSNDQAITLRQKVFLSYLALNNNHSVYAINQVYGRKYYLAPFSIMIMAMIRLKRYDEVRTALSAVEAPTKRILCSDVYQEIERCLDSVDDAPMKEDLQDLLRDITDKGYVSEETLEAAVFSAKPITSKEGFSRTRDGDRFDDDRKDDSEQPGTRYDRSQDERRIYKQRLPRGRYNRSDHPNRPSRHDRPYNQDRSAPRFEETRKYRSNHLDQADRYLQQSNSKFDY